MNKAYIEFMSAVIKIYGSYSCEELQDLTIEYVKNRWKESELDNIYKQLILKKTTVYKDVKPPDPAEFEKLFPRLTASSIEAEALRWWDELNKKSTAWRDCIISDIRAYKAIQMMGGWIWFCERFVKDENDRDIDVWNRKQFVEYFKLYSENRPEEEIKILPGLSEIKKPPVMIGNQEQCLLIQQGQNKTLKLVTDLTNTIKERTAI